MARKRLSDLLREEANKSPNPKSEVEGDDQQQGAEAKSAEAKNAKAKSAEAKEAQPKPSSSQPSAQAEESTAQQSASPKTTNEPKEFQEPRTIEVSASPVTSSPWDDAEPSNSNQTDQAALEATIADLKSRLETVQQAAHQNEAELNQTVAMLQEKLKTQQAVQDDLQKQLQDRQAAYENLQQQLQAQQTASEKLQSELQYTNQLKAELEDAKKMILQLSQVNVKPAPPVPAPKKQAAEPELEPSSAKLVYPAAQPSRPQPTGDRQQHQSALRQILDHPTQPGRLPPMSAEKEKEPDQNQKLSDTDMGWVD